MRTLTQNLSKAMRIGALAALIAAAPAAFADTTQAGSTNPVAHQDFHKHYAEHMQKQLDHLAALLKLEPRQQEAWQAYAKSVMALMPSRQRPPENANVVELSKFHAERMTEMAQRMTDSSHALAMLWGVLDNDQRMTLDRELQREMMQRREFMFSHMHHKRVWERRDASK